MEIAQRRQAIAIDIFDFGIDLISIKAISNTVISPHDLTWPLCPRIPRYSDAIMCE